MSEDAKEPVAAADILAWAKEHGSEVHVEITDDGDLYPFIRSVEVEADPDTHKCTLHGYYCYQEDQPTRGVCYGYCRFTILGVEFEVHYDDHDDFNYSGREIDYGEMDRDEFWSELKELVDIPLYDPCSGGYDFDEDDVSDEDIKENLESPYEVYALDADGDVCAFDDLSEVPGHGDDEEDEGDEDGEEGDFDDSEGSYEIIDEETAFAQLASDRPDITFEMS